jgi:hypothetical protein
VAVLVLRHLQLKRLLENNGNVEVERRVAKGTGPESLSVAVAVAVAAMQSSEWEESEYSRSSDDSSVKKSKYGGGGYGILMDGFETLVERLNHKMKVCNYSAADRTKVLKKTFSAASVIVKTRKQSVKEKRQERKKTVDKWFVEWLQYGEKFPEKKNEVCLDTHRRLNYSVKNMRSKATNNMLNDYQRKLLLENGMELAPTRRRKKVPLAVASVDPGSVMLDVKPLGTTLNTVEASSTAFVSTLSGVPPPEAVASDVTKPPPVEKDVSQSLVGETSSEAIADVTQPLPESVDVSTVVAEPLPEIVDITTLATEADADVTQPLPESVDVCTVVAEPPPEIVDETTLATEADADVTQPLPESVDVSPEIVEDTTLATEADADVTQPPP